MSERVEQMFSQLRRGPWNADPMGVPQEGFGGNGNVESQGWIADDAITADTIQANAITAGKIAANVVTATEIAANTITANEIAANTITASEIAANTITASEIAANTITASEIAANTITASEIAADAITTNELAANAVITENVLAANITSSRIELTISGKNFGANNGSEGTPGMFFDENSNTGLGKASSSTTLFLTSGGSSSMTVHATGISSKNHYPLATATYDLGASGSRWNNLYLVNSPNVSSDERTKRDIMDTPLGLDFVRRLRPVMYRLAETEDMQAVESARAAYDEAAMAEEVRPHADKIRAARAAAVAGRATDAAAAAEVARAREQIAAIQGRHQRRIREADQAKRPGRRQHMGLIAQQVAEALEQSGARASDMSVWTRDPEGNQGLAYFELMAPLIRAIQEVASRLEAVEQLYDHG